MEVGYDTNRIRLPLDMAGCNGALRSYPPITGILDVVFRISTDARLSLGAPRHIMAETGTNPPGSTVGRISVADEAVAANAMEITMVATVTVPLGRNAKFGYMDVDSDAFNDMVREHIWNYGLRQILNDAMADKTDDDGNMLPTDQIVAKAQKRLDALYAGDLRARNGSAAEPADPVEREAFRMARDKITEFFKSLDIWPKKGSNKFQTAVDARRVALHAEPIAASDYIAAYVERNPKITAAAKKIVAERAKSSDDESDLVAAGL